MVGLLMTAGVGIYWHSSFGECLNIALKILNERTL